MAGAFDLVIRGGQVVTAEGAFEGDVAVSGGRIAALGHGLGPGAREIDAAGRLVMPGGVDPHAHVEQLSGQGLMNADTFETGHRAALMGGTTSVISFAAQAKGQPLAGAVADYESRARRGALADHAFHVSVSDPSVPGFHEDLAEMVRAGHRSVKVFTTYAIRLEDREILEIMTVARKEGALVCVHAENDGLIGWTKDRLVASGQTRPEHHAVSHPRLAEIETIERICRFAEFLDCPVMIFHVSTAEGVAAIRAARGRGAPVRAETCPHYLLTTGDVLERDGVEGAKWMCSPPQRTHADQEALWQGLALGDLALVSSDHAPYRFDGTGKLAAGPHPDFPKIANGMPGLETRLPLLFDALVARGHGGPALFAELTSAAPARLYGLAGKGRIAPGMDADIVLWDPGREVTYGADDLHDNVGYNPWQDHTVNGWPETVILRGEPVVEDGRCLASPGSGRWIARPAIGVARSGRPAAEAVRAGLLPG